jgi:hypothetical protein
VKRAILSAIIAWVVGVTFVLATAYLTRSPSYYTAEPVREFFHGILFWAFYVGIVAFPTCLLIVAPLLKFIPPSSGLRHPGIALLVGAASGPVAMYIWAALYLRRAFMPDIREQAHLFFGCASALVGATFAFSYARFRRNTRNG